MSVTVSVAAAEPKIAGTKATAMVHEEPALRVEPQEVVILNWFALAP